MCGGGGLQARGRPGRARRDRRRGPGAIRPTGRRSISPPVRFPRAGRLRLVSRSRRRPQLSRTAPRCACRRRRSGCCSCTRRRCRGTRVSHAPASSAAVRCRRQGTRWRPGCARRTRHARRSARGRRRRPTRNGSGSRARLSTPSVIEVANRRHPVIGDGRSRSSRPSATWMWNGSSSSSASAAPAWIIPGLAPWTECGAGCTNTRVSPPTTSCRVRMLRTAWSGDSRYRAGAPVQSYMVRASTIRIPTCEQRRSRRGRSRSPPSLR